MAEDFLMHYGRGHEDGGNSGRYPYGSGENPYQHLPPFLQQYKDLQALGYSLNQIAEHMHMSTSEVVKARMRDREKVNIEVDNMIVEMKNAGKSNVEIGKFFNKNESWVRERYKAMKGGEKERKITKTVDILKEELKNKDALDVGAGAEAELGVSKTQLATAIDILKEEGYQYFPDTVRIQHPTGLVGHKTTMAVLAKEGIDIGDLYKDPTRIEPIREYHSEDGGLNFNKREYPTSIDSSRIYINYTDPESGHGGVDKDGVIELRPGVPDLSLGQSSYAQVRIAVDDTKYMKGMAMYSDNIPEGYDVVYNTNKKVGTSPDKVFKSMKTDANGEIDKDNPFGAYIKANGQSWYIDPKTGEKKLSAINKLKEEGDWDSQSKTLASQFLSKQRLELIKQQLQLTINKQKSRYEDILAIENPTIRKKMLMDFAGECDEAAEELKAVALPHQTTKVLLPLTCMKDNEIYAPEYKTGERVILVRYPHAGPFEIPELIVNNDRKEARKILGQATDAVGINLKVASVLSGADFDGDTALVIPVNDKVRIDVVDRNKVPAYKQLNDFDPKIYASGGGEGSTMSEQEKGRKMGEVTNLITDMYIKGAPPEDIVKAVKHSMVIIDAYKHGLEWRKSEEDNDIKALKEKWQPETKMHGASTLISKASGTAYRDETKVMRDSNIDPETGKVTLTPTGRTYQPRKKDIDPDTGETIWVDKGGRKVAQEEVSQMDLVDDAFDLSSGTPKEAAYAVYANTMKAMANTARKEYLATKNYRLNDSAKAAYAAEVSSLQAKAKLAYMNKPRERQAQRIATIKIRALKESHPELKEDKDKLGKYKNQALQDARFTVGANKKNVRINPTDKEWEAIQAKAISSSLLNQIMRDMDPKRLNQLVFPANTASTLSSSKVGMIKSMSNRGYTQGEIAEALNISPSTVTKYMNPNRKETA